MALRISYGVFGPCATAARIRATRAACRCSGVGMFVVLLNRMHGMMVVQPPRRAQWDYQFAITFDFECRNTDSDIQGFSNVFVLHGLTFCASGCQVLGALPVSFAISFQPNPPRSAMRSAL
jgi:hypothetical protein